MKYAAIPINDSDLGCIRTSLRQFASWLDIYGHEKFILVLYNEDTGESGIMKLNRDTPYMDQISQLIQKT